MVVVAASRSVGGDVYLDKELLALVQNGNFEKTADKMVAYVDESNIGAFVSILQKNHGLSATITSTQFQQIEKEEQRTSTRKRIELPPPEPVAPPSGQSSSELKKSSTKIISMLELEAEALALELELLAA